MVIWTALHLSWHKMWQTRTVQQTVMNIVVIEIAQNVENTDLYGGRFSSPANLNKSSRKNTGTS